jgi:hypothetical protein
VAFVAHDHGAGHFAGDEAGGDELAPVAIVPGQGDYFFD